MSDRRHAVRVFEVHWAIAWAAWLFLALAPAALAQAPAGAPSEHGTHPHHDDATVHHSFADVQHWTAVFDDPGRDAWQKPEEVVKALGLSPGMCVADLGAGTGYFSRYLARAVGEGGTVLAVDPEPNLVVHLRERSEKEKTANVVPILASFDNPRIPAASADVVLVVDTFHHIDDRVGYFRRLRRALKPGGRVAIVDFKKKNLPVGPPPEHKLRRSEIVSEMESAGYKLVAQPDVLPYQYFLIFQAK